MTLIEELINIGKLWIYLIKTKKKKTRVGSSGEQYDDSYTRFSQSPLLANLGAPALGIKK